MWKICLSGTDTPIDGCESMTAEEVTQWIRNNQVNLEEENEHGDTTMYVALDVE
jgi:hypothetical protein